MNVTKQDVIETASLLNIQLQEEEIATITQSFAHLIAYFSILDDVVTEIEDYSPGDDILRLKDDTRRSFPNPEQLIERSEAHEDNYVLIPNIL